MKRANMEGLLREAFSGCEISENDLRLALNDFFELYEVEHETGLQHDESSLILKTILIFINGMIAGVCLIAMILFLRGI